MGDIPGPRVARDCRAGEVNPLSFDQLLNPFWRGYIEYAEIILGHSPFLQISTQYGLPT